MSTGCFCKLTFFFLCVKFAIEIISTGYETSYNKIQLRTRGQRCFCLFFPLISENLIDLTESKRGCLLGRMKRAITSLSARFTIDKPLTRMQTIFPSSISYRMFSLGEFVTQNVRRQSYRFGEIKYDIRRRISRGCTNNNVIIGQHG